jgi:hypothetical protein
MKKLAILFALALGFAWNSHAQTWTYVQDSIGTYCAGNTSSCTMNGGNMLPTTAGTIWIVIVGTTNNVNISSVTGGGGTWTICSTCHIYDPTVARAISVAYNLTGNTGTGSVTVNLTGNSGTVFSGNFFEFLPPAGSTASFDTAATSVSTSCTTCTGVGLTLSATDLVIQRDAANSPSSWHGVLPTKRFRQAKASI